MTTSSFPTTLPNFTFTPTKYLSSRTRCYNSTRTRHAKDSSYVHVLDTTLRDGEQAPGATLNKHQKLEVARMLVRLGVDVMEVGFPAASRDDLEAVRSIAVEVGNGDGDVPIVAAAARCNRRDIELAHEALKPARRSRINTFIATSEIHMKHKLKKSKEEVVRLAREMISYARSLGFTEIGFAPEDAGRSEREFLYVILEEAIKAGATILMIPDTVGYNLPSDFARLITDIGVNTPGIHNVIVSAHCHNDLGLATANTLFALEAGARQVDVTINGIGERAGNASLEEVVMAIKCRKDALGGLHTGIDTKHIAAASKMFTGLHVQPHKPIVGANVFSHGSGIHQDGYLKSRDTYQIIFPEDIGLSSSTGSGIILGKLSGRAALKYRLLELGHDIEGKELDEVFRRFKDIADKKKHISDHDIEALISEKTSQSKDIWSLGDFQIIYDTLGASTAIVKLTDSDGEEKMACACDAGPIEAAFKAINNIIQTQIYLVEHSANSTSKGSDVVNTSTVVIKGGNNRTFSGNGRGTNTVVASVRAYLCAVNKMLGSWKIPVNDSSSEVAEKLL